MPTAAVVVATHGRPALLDECVAALLTARRAGDEIIVVASGPERVERTWRGVRFEWSEDKRKDAKVNLAAGLTGAEVVVLTDDDCRVEAGWVGGMAAAFEDPVVGVAFGPVRGLTEVPGSRTRPTLPPGPAPIENWQYAHGASMAVRRRALLEVGGFDERLGPGASSAGEEADLVVRLAAHGWRAALADAPVVHHVEWRSPEEEAANQLTYERGAGVWIGAGLRRDPRGIAPLARLRLRHQRALYGNRAERGWAFGPRTSAAFARGVLEGLRLPPRRFTGAEDSAGRRPRVCWIDAGEGEAIRSVIAQHADRAASDEDADLVVIGGARGARRVRRRRRARWVLVTGSTRHPLARRFDWVVPADTDPNTAAEQILCTVPAGRRYRDADA